MREKEYHLEQWEKCFDKKGRACLICGLPAVQLAHGIPQDKRSLARYGWRAVHHWSNLYPVCGLKCNYECQVPEAGREEQYKEVCKKIAMEAEE